MLPVSGSLLSRRPPSSPLGPGEVQFPSVVSTMRASAQLPTHASPVTYLFRFRGPRDPSLLRARCCQRSRADGGSDRARTIVQPAVLFAGSLSRGREWDLFRFSGDPSCAFAPVQDPGRTDVPSPMTVSSMLPLPLPRQRLQHCSYRGYCGASAPAVYASRTVLPPPHAKTRFRLAGWPLPGGS